MERSSLAADEVTLQYIATGILALHRATLSGASPSLPYPVPLQLGLNRMVATCLERGVAPPQGVPDLLLWARRSLDDWPLALPETGAGAQGALIEDHLPTSLCDAWACAAGGGEDEITEQQVMRLALGAAQNAGAPDAYVLFRRLLIERPVLTAFELQQQCVTSRLEVLRDAIHLAYEAAPGWCSIDGEFHCCGSCGNLLFRRMTGDLFCEDETCRRLGRSRPGRRLALRENVSWLKRGLRRFVAAPGRAELRLEGVLRRRGVEVVLWPSFDRYDLRLTFPDGQSWAVDVKDWADPVLLARRVNESEGDPIPQQPRWNRAYFVFPNERRKARPDYVRAFRNRCRSLSEHVRADFMSGFIRDVGRKLREVKTDA